MPTDTESASRVHETRARQSPLVCIPEGFSSRARPTSGSVAVDGGQGQPRVKLVMSVSAKIAAWSRSSELPRSARTMVAAT